MFCELTYGLKDGIMVHVDSVENGISCECICANCKAPLVARNGGRIRGHHFAHHNISECEGAVETALHLLAKQVFYNKKVLTTPEYYYYSEQLEFGDVIHQSKEHRFDHVEVESRITLENSFFIPDAIGHIEGKPPLLIEFANTHFIDEEKKKKIKLGNYACIEIDLSCIELSEEAILEVLEDPHAKSWISYPSLEKKAESFLSKIKTKQEEINKQRILQTDRLNKQKSELNQEKYNSVIFDKGKKLITHKKLFIECPLYKNQLSKLKDTNFYDHPILKRIISGEYWNGEIYGKTYYGHSNGKSIFLKNERIYIYPPDGYFGQNEFGNCDFFWKGIKTIQGIREDIKCWNCKYCEDEIEMNYSHYSVCIFPKEVK